MGGSERHLGSTLMRWVISCLIVLGSVALWTALPLAWVTATAAVVSHGGARFIIVLFGCPLTMGLVGLMLAVLEEHRRALSPAEEPRALLEPMLVLSGLIAVVGLVLWWFFVAESSNPSGPLQPI